MAITVIQNQLIGTGIIFPIKLTSQGRVEISGGLQLIRASIVNIISWPYANRYFLNEFGSRIYELTDEQNDAVLISLLRQFVIDSISNWEKRVKLVNVDINRNQFDSLNVELTYNIIATQQEDTFIFPFYTEIKF